MRSERRGCKGFLFLPVRGVKGYSLLSLAARWLPGKGTWEAAQIGQQGPGGRAGLMDGVGAYWQQALSALHLSRAGPLPLGTQSQLCHFSLSAQELWLPSSQLRDLSHGEAMALLWARPPARTAGTVISHCSAHSAWPVVLSQWPGK